MFPNENFIVGGKYRLRKPLHITAFNPQLTALKEGTILECINDQGIHYNVPEYVFVEFNSKNPHLYIYRKDENINAVKDCFEPFFDHINNENWFDQQNHLKRELKNELSDQLKLELSESSNQIKYELRCELNNLNKLRTQIKDELNNELSSKLKEELNREQSNTKQILLEELSLQLDKHFINNEFPTASHLNLNANKAINDEQILLTNILNDIGNQLKIKSSLGEFKLVYYHNFNNTLINKISNLLKEKGFKGTAYPDRIEIHW